MWQRATVGRHGDKSRGACALAGMLAGAALGGLLGAPVASGDTIKRLVDGRAAVVAPAYGPEERGKVAEQVEVHLRDLYPHTAQKISWYGPLVAPAPRVAVIRDVAAQMTDDAFHRAMRSVYGELRDLHTNYLQPEPLDCYVSFLPFALADAWMPAGEAGVVVDRLSEAQDVRALLPEDFRRLQRGDRILTWDGAPVDLAVKAHWSEGGGANESGGRSRALEVMTSRWHWYLGLPARDYVDLTVRHRSGEVTALTLPWLLKDRCGFEAATPAWRRPARYAVNEAVDGRQEEFQRLFPGSSFRPAGVATEDLFDLSTTEDDHVQWTLFETERGSFGYIFIDSFRSDTGTPAQFVETVRKLLTGPLAGTEGLVIDVRGNPGGTIMRADRLVQLFGGERVEPMLFRARATAAGAHIAGKIIPETAFPAAIAEALARGDEFTVGLPITEPAEANDTGTAYFAPVAVLTDSRCYSACDQFTALMQDRAHALIFATDARTGGGGANVLTHSWVLDQMLEEPGPLKALPGGQELRFAWRAMVRTGRHRGELVEDAGVARDVAVRRTLADVLRYDELLMRSVVHKLQKVGVTRGRYVTSDPAQVVAEAEAAAGVAIRVAGVDQVAVFDGDVELARVDVAPADTVAAVEISVPWAGVDQVRATVVGYRAGVPQWRAPRQIRWVRVHPVTDAGWLVPLVAGESPLTIFDSGANPGWRFEDSALVVGQGAAYEPNIDSSATLAVKLPSAPPLCLRFAAEGEIESDYDFLTVRAITSGSEKQLARYTGPVAVKPGFDLSAFAGRVVQLEWRFTSDSEYQTKGVRVSGIHLDPAGCP